MWAATTKDADLLRSQGFKRMVWAYADRKEVVAGNLSEYLTDREYWSLLNIPASDALLQNIGQLYKGLDFVLRIFTKLTLITNATNSDIYCFPSFMPC